MPEEIKKSQGVRLWDVFFLGPVMMYIGWTNKIPAWQKALLISAGALTVYYNGGNYLRNLKQNAGN
jgi:hypothetical protein